ncbi:hypothetical protein P879_10781 [Paragonimus westermani]|uniref:Uncharacterized protein n=1 Tax=Paragonimus westermani TaxID=34504 RepID=A0A8T0DED2_9TREM|nr:hypothetical protein P879_10781 [Paragonimus westermani]
MARPINTTNLSIEFKFKPIPIERHTCQVQVVRVAVDARRVSATVHRVRAIAHPVVRVLAVVQPIVVGSSGLMVSTPRSSVI